jgi:MFS family permease
VIQQQLTHSDAATTNTRTVLTSTIGTLLVMMSFTSPLATTHQVTVAVGAGPAGQSWILSSMSLGLTLAILTCGALADDFGRRRVFCLGAVVLALASVASAVAPSTVVFVLSRVASGIGGAAVLACSLALISHALPPGHARVRAMGMWGAAVGGGIALGPVAASLAADYWNWRAMYWLLALLAAGLAVAGRTLLRESTSGASRTIDVPGVVLLAGGIAGVLAGLTEGHGGWLRPLPLVLLIGGVVLLAGFVLVQARSRGAMIDLALFRSRLLRDATIASFTTGAGITALMSFIPTELQQGLGRGALFAAVLLLAWSVTSVVAALAARRLGNRVSPTTRLATGLLVTAAGIAATTALSAGAVWQSLLPGLIVAGIGTGLVNATLGGQAVASVPAHRAGMGSGINNTSRYLGAALGVTVVFVLSVHPGQPNAFPMAGWDVSAIVCACVMAVGALLVAVRR